MNPAILKYWGLRGRWIGWRNHVLASPRFQRFAQRCWLTRPIARRRATALFDLVAGFSYSQILAACVESGVLRLLAERPHASAELAVRIDVPLAGAERLLRAAAALGLVEPLGAGWALGSAGAALLGNGGISEMIAHHHLLYADLADPLGLLRRGGGGGALSGLWHYAESAGQSGSDVAAYSALMAASQPLVAGQAIDAYRFDRHRRLLDVGGGEGAFLRAVAARVPCLQLGLFDLPPVIARARARFESMGLADRTTFVGGDFLRDPLPEGYDIVSLVRVLHDHDDTLALALLRAIHAALPSGGVLIIIEPMAQAPGAVRVGDAYFGFYLLAMGSGRPRSASEIRAMLIAAGFRSARQRRTAMPITTSLVVAIK
ncbi:methyltransferase [Sphingomonas qilianensis]|uniref:Methyltransferase n=1 Tax=Sphingomonas qilianensis TaxID=1736690 RepID=A0ABU9XWL5_9SPHN